MSNFMTVDESFYQVGVCLFGRRAATMGPIDFVQRIPAPGARASNLTNTLISLSWFPPQ